MLSVTALLAEGDHQEAIKLGHPFELRKLGEPALQFGPRRCAPAVVLTLIEDEILQAAPAQILDRRGAREIAGEGREVFVSPRQVRGVDIGRHLFAMEERAEDRRLIDQRLVHRKKRHGEIARLFGKPAIDRPGPQLGDRQPPWQQVDQQGGQQQGAQSCPASLRPPPLKEEAYPVGREQRDEEDRDDPEA